MIANEQDKLILFELLQDCRQSVSKIAKTVGLPQQTTSRRIAKMESAGIIKKYTIDVDYHKLGFDKHFLYLDLQGINGEEMEGYLGSIADIKEVSCRYTLHPASKWTLYVSIWTRDIKRYDEVQSKIIGIFGDHVRDYLSFQSVQSHIYFAKILNPKGKAKVDIKEGFGDIKLDKIDWKLIRAFKKNSRVPILNIARELGLNASSITKRINSLKKMKVIQRFYPLLDIKKLGYSEYGFIIRINPLHKEKIGKLVKFAERDSRSVILTMAAGYFNLHYDFLVEDDNDLKDMLYKVDETLGDGIWEIHKIKVDSMIS
jgi:Lrp/AsnC family leucine-responsive transcriptional regulator